MAPLVPLLQKRGLRLIELPVGNFELAAHTGLLVKDSYWRWSEREWVGNTTCKRTNETNHTMGDTFMG